MSAPDARSSLERLAIQHVNGEASDGHVARELYDLRRDIPPWQRWALLEDLKDALEFRQKVDDGDVTVFEVEPELAHPDVLGEKAQQGVEEALDALIHGGTLRAALKAEALARVPLTTPERTAS